MPAQNGGSVPKRAAARAGVAAVAGSSEAAGSDSPGLNILPSVTTVRGRSRSQEGIVSAPAHKGSSLTSVLVVGGKHPTGQNVQVTGPGKSLYRKKTANPQCS